MIPDPPLQTDPPRVRFFVIFSFKNSVDNIYSDKHLTDSNKDNHVIFPGWKDYDIETKTCAQNTFCTFSHVTADLPDGKLQPATGRRLQQRLRHTAR